MMMNFLQCWPEPVVRVQHLSETGLTRIPQRYVKKPSDRPHFPDSVDAASDEVNNIPVIDMQELLSDDMSLRRKTAALIKDACREWGFFQVVNHGVRQELMERTRGVWREFFKLPLEEKQKYANTPSTYEGYGSRVGVEKGIKLDWCDYFFLHYLPMGMRDQTKWPSFPLSCRELVEEYSKEVVKVGLQVRHRHRWLTVTPIPNAFIVNLGDQLQVVSNGIYKSVEHRVIVNSVKERVSLALFYNPKGDILMKPAEQLVTKDHPPLYPPMTFDQYRLHIRTRGPSGKSQVDSLLLKYQQ
ncbi:UNVERIFIED_CONTAM: putative 2-oxoglutarate-dependent dioxygenase [Sesamum latifolium]|uniref:2-oxoglutarate-dependent dioxygenase n=1 Tax=Sesamum latifolium TaxID=2727402 RepID=A0AAW2VDL8_9LAMI